jgi:hypothetical protein
MKKIGWIFRLSNEQPSSAMIRCIAGGIGIAVLGTLTGIAVAQTPATGASIATPATQTVVPDGYSIHQTVDMGGHMTGIDGSGAMYNTMVNMHSGPRVLNQTAEMRALPGQKGKLFDILTANSSGYGGDPTNFTRLNASKGKLWDFSGLFRRDRQYFDYDLLGNPNITTGQSIPVGPSNAATSRLAWPQVQHSPVMFNTVRRMTDVNLTLFPLAAWTVRFGYSHSTMEGPTLSPAYTIMKYDGLLQQYQRNGNDNYSAALDWKPVNGTKLTIEQEINKYKADSFFTLDPNGFMVQEADGTPAYLGNWDSQTAYGIAACNTASMGTGYTSSSNYTILSTNPNGGKPIINPACAVVTSYMRTQPTRTLLPTTMVRLQSNSIQNLAINADLRYTLGTMDLSHYYENAQGLSGAIRSIIYSGGYAKAHRAVLTGDLGVVWQATNRFSLADQISFSNVKEPGYSIVPIAATLSTPAAPNQTINYTGALTAGTAQALPHGINGTMLSNYYGQRFFTNDLTAAFDVSARARMSLTYRFGNRVIGQGVPHTGELEETDPVSGELTIVQTGGIFNAAFRPASNWDINGTVEVIYDDNTLTPIGPRQTKQYRMHTIYRAKSWATINGAFTDRERHDNTNNAQEVVAAGTVYQGPINHEDHSRVFSVGADLMPNEHYGINVNYAYTDVYSSTNVCYNNGATATLPGAVESASAKTCPGIYARGSTTQLADWFGRDFMDAPTQSGSVALALSPNAKIHTNLGYRISDVNGTRFFSDAREVNGSLVSRYQSPFVNLAWTSRPGLTWKAEYNYFGYGEGGPSGSQYCTTSTSTTTVPVLCSSLAYPTGLTEPTSGLTAARVFHANNVTLGLHYEF